MIVGFGRTGHIIARLLSEQMVPFVAIDMNMSRVSEGRKMGLPVFFGDARRTDIFQAIGIERAKAVVLTLDHAGTISRTLLTLKRHFKKLPIFVRAHDIDHAKKLKKVGAIIVIPEMIEPSLQLGSQILLSIGISKEQVNKAVETLRHKISAHLTLKNEKESTFFSSETDPPPL